VAGTICFIPLDWVRTDFAGLRPGAPARSPVDTAPLPLRVMPTSDGGYQLLDGFKRLRGWQAHGYSQVPVVMEQPCSSAEQKRLLLTANCPARTLTALDEARVVASLLHEDRLTPLAVARLLHRKPEWVARRRMIGERLSPAAQSALASGSLGPTVSHALCALPAVDQDVVLRCFQTHQLTQRETLALIGSYRVADTVDRRALLDSPLSRTFQHRA